MRSGRKLRWALLALPIAVALASATPSLAAPVVGPAGMAFYTPPSPLPAGGPGNLVWYRPTTINLDTTIPSVSAWDVLYQSTDGSGQPDVVTGTVIVPTAAWTGSGARPVITIGSGTQGLAQSCAPSLEMLTGGDYDGAEIVGALQNGWAVVLTDYQGYTNGATPTYINGVSEGHALLDIVRAAAQLPGAGVGSGNPVAVWGYSQGGQAAAWAGQLLSSYAPELDVVGVAAGGVPADLDATNAYSNGAVGSAFVLDAVIGLAQGAGVSLASYENPAGVAAQQQITSECAIQALADFRDVDLSTFTLGNESLTQLEQQIPAIQSEVQAQKLGGQAVPVPVYHYHGLVDEFVPVTQDFTLHKQWCALGVKDEFVLYPGEHLLSDPSAVNAVTQWIGDRLAGKAAPDTCSDGSALPAGAATTPQTGDLVVPQDNWSVSGSVKLAKIGLSLAMPAGTAMSANADLTSHTLTGSLTIPPVNQTFSLLGLPINLAASMVPTGPLGGSVSLADNGTLTINASSKVELTLKSVGISLFTVPLGCRTTTPITLPLSTSVSSNGLANGLAISGTVTIPPFTGCGLLGSLLNVLVSGSGNQIKVTAVPPAPTPY